MRGVCVWREPRANRGAKRKRHATQSRVLCTARSGASRRCSCGVSSSSSKPPLTHAGYSMAAPTTSCCHIATSPCCQPCSHIADTSEGLASIGSARSSTAAASNTAPATVIQPARQSCGAALAPRPCSEEDGRWARTQHSGDSNSNSCQRRTPPLAVWLGRAALGGERDARGTSAWRGGKGGPPRGKGRGKRAGAGEHPAERPRDGIARLGRHNACDEAIEEAFERAKELGAPCLLLGSRPKPPGRPGRSRSSPPAIPAAAHHPRPPLSEVVAYRRQLKGLRTERAMVIRRSGGTEGGLRLRV